jgi:hypothetical protein
MKNKSHHLRNILLIFFGIVILLMILTIVFISPIAKYLIEKYDVKYTGREITLDWIYVNPFTGYIHANDLKIYESKSKDIFIESGGATTRFDMSKMLHKEYEMQYLTLDEAKIFILQYDSKRFNFTDIVEKFSAKKDKKEDTAHVHFNLLNIKLVDSEIHYKEGFTPVNYFIKKVNILSSGFHWNSDTLANKVSFETGTGKGNVQGNFFMNTHTLSYKMNVKIQKMDMKIVEQYLKVMTNYGTFRAFIDADVDAKGNFNNGKDVDARGRVAIHEFHFGKTPTEDFVAFQKFVLNVNKLNPEKKLYLIDSISLTKPFVKYERYDGIDNIGTIFGKKGSKVQAANAAKNEQFNLIIELADYVKLLAKDFFKSEYKVNRLKIYDGNLRFNDCSISEKFSMALDPFNIVADSINSNNKRVFLRLKTGVKPYGNLGVTLAINPKDSSDFNVTYNLEQVNATVLNPYIVKETSYPLDRGTIAFRGETNVEDGVINSKNNLLIIDPRITKRVKNKGNSWLPLGVIMFFARDNGNAIDYQIPITGRLKDPNFHFSNIIWNVLVNTFVKPATIPYRSEVKTVENTIEKFLAFDWQMGMPDLMPDHEPYIKNIAKFLNEHPEASIIVQPVIYVEKEEEYISFFDAKKMYYNVTHKKKPHDTLSEDDSTDVMKLSIKDKSFVEFLNSHVKDKRKFSVQEKCMSYVGEENVDKKIKAIQKQRLNLFLNYFKENNLMKRVTVKESKEEVPFDGFSYFKVLYNGKIPDSLKEAYDKISQLDNENPRAKLKGERNKVQKFLDIFRGKGK